MSPAALKTPVPISVFLDPNLSTNIPPSGAPNNPLRPAADSKAPAPIAPPGRTCAAINGMLANLHA